MLICLVAITLVVVESKLDCPTWMHRVNNTDKCACGSNINYIVKCNSTTKELYILKDYLITYDKELNESLLGLSLFGHVRDFKGRDTIYNKIPTDKYEIDTRKCGPFNRTGRLCGACKQYHYPLVYSYVMNCEECTITESRLNWVKYFSRAFIPLTLFYIFVVLFKFNANSPSVHTCILFSQLVSSPVLIRSLYKNRYGPVVFTVIKILVTLHGVWNLDLFRMVYPNLCLRVSSLLAISLDYLVAFYPLFLILVTYLLSDMHSKGYRIIVFLWIPFGKCFHQFRRKWDINSSLVDVFATFMFLSYNRILSVTFELIVYVHPYNSRGQRVGRFLYYDPTIKYFGPEHRYYGALSIILLCIFNIFPIVILLLYPMQWFHRVLNHFRLSHVVLHTFVDSYTGYYKDGTKPGEKDCRYFAAAFLFLPILLHISYATILNVYYNTIGGVVLTMYCLAFALCQPYKDTYRQYGKVAIVVLTLSALSNFLSLGVDIAAVKMSNATQATLCCILAVSTLPPVFIIVLVIRWIKLNMCSKLFTKVFRLERSTSLIAVCGGRNKNSNNYHSI